MGNPYDDYVSLLLFLCDVLHYEISMCNRCYFAKKSKKNK